MRKKVLTEGFPEPKDEIYFFKHVKPEVSSKVIFYTELFNLETYRPNKHLKKQI